MPIYDLSIQEAETELLQVWGQFRLQSKTMSQNTHMHTPEPKGTWTRYKNYLNSDSLERTSITPFPKTQVGKEAGFYRTVMFSADYQLL